MCGQVSLANHKNNIEGTIEFHEAEIEPGIIDWNTTWKPMAFIIGAFLIIFWLPIDSERFTNAVIESLALAGWHTQKHVLLCLVPAFLYCRRRIFQ